MRMLQPEGWAPPEGFSHGVVTSGHHVFVAGQTGCDEHYAFHTDDFGAQAELALQNLVTVLRVASADPSEIARMNWYVTDVAEFHRARERVLAAYLRTIGAHRPAMTLVQVGALLSPEAKIEIDAVAVVAPRSAVSVEPDYYDREYDTLLAVPDFPALVARAAENAAAARARLECRLDLRYGDGAEETLDVFPARGGGDALLMFIHGGYWGALDKSQHSHLAAALVDAGIHVAVINYPLIPAVTLYRIVESVRNAAMFLWRRAPELGFRADRLFAAGQSAGGHLTAMLLATRWRDIAPELPDSMVAGGLAISGLHDLEPLTKAPFIRDRLGLRAADVPRLSPARLSPNPAVRVVTAVGGLETREFHWQSRLLAERWPEAFVEDVPMPGRHHVNVVDDLAVRGTALFNATLRLVGKD